jgi:DNA (cytosine-5)-methyltransferase 1
MERDDILMTSDGASAVPSGPSSPSAKSDAPSTNSYTFRDMDGAGSKEWSELRVADLFCGAGGLSEGFRSAGCPIVAGVDSDPDACASYAQNFPEAVSIYGDLRQKAIRERFLEAAHDVDVLVGGPPCQGFSQVRNHTRLVEDPRNRLYREFVRALGDIRPAGFVMENVPGLAEVGVKEQVLDDLSLDGEYIVVAQLHDAADFGVPQTRRRLVFMGVRAGYGVGPPRVEGTGASRLLSLARRERGGLLRYEVVGSSGITPVRLLERLEDPTDLGLVTAAQALSDLSVLPPGTRRDEIEEDALPGPASAYQRLMRQGSGALIGNTSVPRINPDTVLRLAGIPAGGNHRDLPDDLRERYLTGNRWGPSNGTGRLGRRHYYAYRRLHSDLWSWTLNTKADSVYHYGALRALSVREFARLQSFPDRFTFTTDPRRGNLDGRIEGGPGHSRYRQAGNAVPPLLAQAVAEALAGMLQAGKRKSA